MKLYDLTIEAARELLQKKEITSKELTSAVFDRIEAVDKNVNAYITTCRDSALVQAEKADKAIAAGKAAPLTGIPIAVKDNICTEQINTTCGSKILEEFIPQYNATVVDKLNAAGAVMLGKTNLDEFAMGSSTEMSAMGPTRNPWDLEFIPGGSSGGSAAAVSADTCLGALGSDTGGSIRQPASHCGVVGLKPTYGRVSRYGLVAFASSLDQIGPISKSVMDSALLLNAVAGHDPKDSTSVPREVPDFTKSCTSGIKGLKVGIPKEYYDTQGIDDDVLAAVKNAVNIVEDLGGECVDISLPHTEYAVAVYYVIAPSEASSNLARYDGVKYGYRKEEAADLMTMYQQTRSDGFGAEVKRRILLGTFSLSAGYYDAYYGKASQVRTLIRNDFSAAFEKCDVILSPVAPTPAFKLGEKIDDPLTMYLLDIFTISANLAGIPGMSIPCGFSKEGLPIGLQLLGNYFDEETLFKVAYNLEQPLGLQDKKPAL